MVPKPFHAAAPRLATDRTLTMPAWLVVPMVTIVILQISPNQALPLLLSSFVLSPNFFFDWN